MTHIVSVRSISPFSSRVSRPISGFALAMLLAALLSGCAAIAAPVAFAADTPARYPPLQYHRWVGTATPDELASERLRLEQDPETLGNVVSATQLALLLSASPLAEGEGSARAQEILETPRNAPLPWARQSEYAMFAELWLSVLSQQALVTELSESKSADQQHIAQLQQQIQQLEKKIEALTSIEQQLIEREQAQDLD